MGNVAIRVEGLGKLYRIGGKQERYRTLRDTLSDAFTAPFKRARNLLRGQAYGAAGLQETIWALKDVSFEIKHGEVVGIIGRNGAGKSTLLKILSRITEPTEGYADVYGRVGSLLEVGTGFHPELTGRENIYLNGAILGMGRKEIDRKFDEIVDFAEVEKFIDTPVKHYSSGMYLRLAFAVAAHLEPEILLVDEVLAVGDAQFQKKCLGKMSDVASEGRTVLFVSHNMAAIQALCSRAFVLSYGTVAFDGGVNKGINSYLRSVEDVMEAHSLGDRRDRKGGELFRFHKVEFLDADNMSPLVTLVSGQDVLIKFDYINNSDMILEDVSLAIGFFIPPGQFLFSCRSDVIGKSLHFPPGKGSSICRIPKWPLNRGNYHFNVIAYMKGECLDWVVDAGSVQVETGDYYGTGKLPAANRPGVFIEFDWLVCKS